MSLRHLLILLFITLAACAGPPATPAPTQRLYLTDPRAHYHFDTGAEGWGTWVAAGDQALFRVNDRALEAAVLPNLGYIWSLSGRAYRDAAIQATVQQTEGQPGNGFGVLCRADASGNGYYFLISSTGYFSIRNATDAHDDPLALVDWQSSDAIRQGTEPNQLFAVCVNDYLAFSVNDRFLAETRDSTHSAGELGVALGAVQDAAWVRFDEIIVREAAIAGPR